jgi:hypothetical protein
MEEKRANRAAYVRVQRESRSMYIYWGSPVGISAFSKRIRNPFILLVESETKAKSQKTFFHFEGKKLGSLLVCSWLDVQHIGVHDIECFIRIQLFLFR